MTTPPASASSLAPRATHRLGPIARPTANHLVRTMAAVLVLASAAFAGVHAASAPHAGASHPGASYPGATPTPRSADHAAGRDAPPSRDVAVPPLAVDGRPPASLNDLRAIGDRTDLLLPDLVAATCAVGRASGVFVGPDLVLTAAHVVRSPGRIVRITLDDGRRVRTRSLGLDHRTDLALLRVTEPDADIERRWRPIAPDDSVVRDTWCWMLGHPGGRRDEGPPLRVGRVHTVRGGWVSTDCEMRAGDSGGPLFDAQGRVIAVHSRIGRGLDQNHHGLAATVRGVWDELLAGEILGVPDDDARDRDGDDGGDDAGDGNEPDDVGGEVAEGDDRRRPPIGGRPSAAWRIQLPALVEPLTDAVSPHVLDVLDGGRRIALATVVARDRAVTKATLLDDEVICRLPDGERVTATVLHVSEADDLALLQVPGADAPAPLADVATPVGMWLATPRATRRGNPGVGVVSLERVALPRRPLLGIYLSSGPRAIVTQVTPGEPAALGGMQVDDRIVSIGPHTVRGASTVDAALRNFAPGDTVDVTVERGEATAICTLVLGAHPNRQGPIAAQQQSGYWGRISAVRLGFGSVIQHDTVIEPTACGGPILDLDGRVVGINIARDTRTSSLAIPAARVRELLTAWKRAERDARPILGAAHF